MRGSRGLAMLAAVMTSGAATASQRLYGCGDDQVREYAITGDSAVEAWRWTAAQAPDLPVAYRTTSLARIDDGKPVEGGKAILVTASTGCAVPAFSFCPHGRTPRLTETARWTLPGRRDGHDLSPTPEGGYVVTTDDGTWRFDPDSAGFAPVVALNPALRVKAVSVTRGTMAWVQAEESWWAHGFTVANRDGTSPRRIATPGMKLYKVRWIR